MNKLTLFAITIASALLFSCETDVDINADFQDITVVHSAINPNDNVHYVKINRAFLQDGVDANDLAANSDNFNYPDGELTATVDEVRGDNGNFVQSFPLARTVNEIPKNPGIFANDSNVLFKFSATINRNNRYKLKIVNNKLNKEITSETLIVSGGTLSSPTTQQKMSFWNGNLQNGLFINRTFSFTTGRNVGRVQGKLIFNYTDHFIPSSGKPSVSRKIVMNLGEKKTLNTVSGNDALEFSLDGTTFFDNIVAGTPANVLDLSHREIGNISFEFIQIGSELNVFMEVKEPSNNLNQEKPNFTNINNGLGIFSSIEQFNWISVVDPLTGNINLTDQTISKIRSLGLNYCFSNSQFSGFACPF